MGCWSILVLEARIRFSEQVTTSCLVSFSKGASRGLSPSPRRPKLNPNLGASGFVEGI